MRRAVALIGLVGMLGAGMSLAVLPTTRTVAASSDERTFLIPASDGYGVADCLVGGSTCGTIVADAWCEAHGFSRAETFGPAAEEVTGSTEAVATKQSERPIAITCAS